MRFLNTRLLGIIGIIGAPWIFIDFINNGLYERFVLTSASGVRNVLFMTGWTCSVLGLYQLKAMGTKQWQKIIMIIQLVLLCLANCWNIWEIVAPDSPSFIFFALNFAWPAAGFFMILTAIIILKAKRLKGWKLYMPLLAGLWFPQTVAAYYLSTTSLVVVLISGLYSTIVFSLLGLSLVIGNYEPSIRRRFIS